MNYDRLLQKIGFSEQETRVYLDLLENGVSNISDMAKRTGYHRQVIYRTVPILREAGIVNVTLKGKRNAYWAESPEKLQSILDRLSSEFQSALPLLQGLYESQKYNRPSLKILEGKKGVRYIFSDIVSSLKKGDVYYRYTARKPDENYEDYLPKDYRTLRDEKQLERMVITNSAFAGSKKPKLEREVVVIPQGYDLFEENVTKIIYGSKVAIVDYNTHVSYIIESPVFANFERKVFELLFRFLRKNGD